MEFQRFEHIGILFGSLHDRFHDCFLKDAFLNARRVVAVFLAIVKAVDASPYNLFLSIGCPGASAIWRSAFSADQKLCECVLAGIASLFCFRSDLLDFPLSAPSCHFFLYSAEGSGVDDCRMIVLDLVFRALAIIDHDLLGQAISDVGLAAHPLLCAFASCILQATHRLTAGWADDRNFQQVDSRPPICA